MSNKPTHLIEDVAILTINQQIGATGEIIRSFNKSTGVTQDRLEPTGSEPHTISREVGETSLGRGVITELTGERNGITRATVEALDWLDN